MGDSTRSRLLLSAGAWFPGGFLAVRGDVNGRSMCDSLSLCSVATQRRLPSLFVVAPATSALCPSRRVSNTTPRTSGFHVLTTSPGLPDSDRTKNEFVLCQSFTVHMCSTFLRFSPVWSRRRQEESCGSLVKAQASARVDVPTASCSFCSADPGVQRVCKLLCECLAMCLSGIRP